MAANNCLSGFGTPCDRRRGALPRRHFRAPGRIRLHPNAVALARPTACRQMHEIDVAQPLAATKTGRHTRAVPRCSARSLRGEAGLAMRAPASVRRTAEQEFQRRCSKAMHAEHADGDRAAAPRSVTRCWQRVSVHIECVIDGLGAARKHRRVLRVSPYCKCYENRDHRCLCNRLGRAEVPGLDPRNSRGHQSRRALATDGCDMCLGCLSAGPSGTAPSPNPLPQGEGETGRLAFSPYRGARARAGGLRWIFSVLRRRSHATPSRQVAGHSSRAAVISKVGRYGKSVRPRMRSAERCIEWWLSLRVAAGRRSQSWA